LQKREWVDINRKDKGSQKDLMIQSCNTSATLQLCGAGYSVEIPQSWTDYSLPSSAAAGER